MQARTRLLALSSAAGLVCLVIALGFVVHGVRREPKESQLSETVSFSSAPAPVSSGDAATSGNAATAPVAKSDIPALAEPIDARALVRSARASLEAGSPAEAESLALLAVGAAPGSSGAWNMLGRAQLALEKVSDAETSFERACQKDSTNAWAWNNRGYVHLQCGEWVEARDALETAVGLRDDIAYFHNNLGLAYERTGRFAEAAASFERALALDPTHPTARIAFDRVSVRQQPAYAVAPAESSQTKVVSP
jgi:Flp pilus assembly protein TadD